MKLKLYLSKISQLAKINHMLILGLGGMFIANLLLAALAILMFFHQETIIAPPTLDKPFTLSESGVDASYLQQMTLFFLSARFDVTPQNVDIQHQVILDYTDSGAYHTVESVLNDEARIIEKNNMSSAFFLTAPVQVDTTKLAVQVKGTLKKWVGDRNLPDESKTYLIFYSYHYGQLRIKEVEESDNATP